MAWYDVTVHVACTVEDNDAWFLIYIGPFHSAGLCCFCFILAPSIVRDYVVSVLYWPLP